ncbi:hypothetical protein AAE478_009004 [Parahypoxylon ruwenzoriense]
MVAQKKIHPCKAEQCVMLKQQVEAEKVSQGLYCQQQAQSYPSDEAPPSTLGFLFDSLPLEIRNEIFAWLLVRPVKWDVTHRQACVLRDVAFSNYAATVGCRDQLIKGACDAERGRPWSRRPYMKHMMDDPWRSRWAPPKEKPWQCSVCWDAMNRRGPRPGEYLLPCLCARRENLETLLVCRRWYAEAGRVFYSRNVFAFGDMRECSEFLLFLPDRWKKYLIKVSLLAYYHIPTPGRLTLRDPRTEPFELNVPIEGKHGMRWAWKLLSGLPALSELELDAAFLAVPEYADVLRGPALKNLRRVTFVQSEPHLIAAHTCHYVWPRFGARTVIEDSELADTVGREIKGQRYGWVRGKENRTTWKEMGVELVRYVRLVLKLQELEKAQGY